MYNKNMSSEEQLTTEKKMNTDLVAQCEADEKSLAKCSKDYLIAEVKRHHRICDLREHTKWDLIAEILRARHGVRVLKQCKGWH